MPILAILTHYLKRDSPIIHDRELAIYFAPVSKRKCPFLGCLQSCQVQRLQQCLLAWEDAALAVKPAIGAIKALYGIRSVNYLPYI